MTEKPAFTPGPWVYAGFTGKQEIATVAHCGDWVIGFATEGFPGGNYRDGFHGDCEADARLIAAAPCMFEALVSQIEAHRLLCIAAELDHQAHLDGTSQARAALSKALGKDAP